MIYIPFDEYVFFEVLHVGAIVIFGIIMIRAARGYYTRGV